jgi:hypothetical protein
MKPFPKLQTDRVLKDRVLKDRVLKDQFEILISPWRNAWPEPKSFWLKDRHRKPKRTNR